METTALDIFLLASNVIFLAIIPWLWLIAKRRNDMHAGHWFPEVSWAVQLTIWSIFNHTCSLPSIGWCIGQTDSITLLNLDIVHSLMMVSSTVAIFLNGRSRETYLPIMYPFTMILIFTLGDTYVGMLVVFLINLCVLLYRRFFCMLFNPKRHWPIYVSFLGFAGAFALKTMSNQYYPMSIHNSNGIEDYEWFHSWWHILAGLASIVLCWDARLDDEMVKIDSIV